MWPDDMAWLNPPPLATRDRDSLNVVTGREGDFWRDTFYGFRHDNGHAFLATAPSEFTAEVHFRADYQAQYDQAGLFLRADAAHWIKAGIEFVNGVAHLATVITNERSDWSQMALPPFDGPFGLRLTRVGDAVWVQYLKGDTWAMFRLGYFPPERAARVGPMACSPLREGLAVSFTGFRLSAPVSKKPY